MFTISTLVFSQGWEVDSPGRILIETSEGDYVTINEVYVSNEDFRVSINKIADDGAIIWSQEHQLPPEQIIPFFFDGVQTNEGDFFAVGYSTLSDLSDASLLLKFDTEGNLVFNTTLERDTFPHPTFPELTYTVQPLIRNIILSSDGNIILTGRGFSSINNDPVIVKKLTVDGEKIWTKSFSLSNGGEINAIEKSNGNIVIAGDIQADFLNNNTTGLFLMELTEEGELLTYKEFGSREDKFHNLIQTFSGEFVMVGAKGSRDEPGLSSQYSTFALKLNPIFDSLWMKTYISDTLTFQTANTFSNNVMASNRRLQGSVITEDNNGDFLIFGGNTKIFYYQATDDSTWINDGILIRTDLHGNEKWHKSVSTPPVKYREIVSCLLNQHNQLIVGGHNLVAKLDSLGNIYSNFINGKVFFDSNTDCNENSNEQSLENWYLKATNALNTFHGLSDEQGNYTINVDTGSYNLEVIPPNAYWNWVACNPLTALDLPTQYDLVNVNIPVQAETDCPYLTVDISTSFLRKCFESTYWVHYCNQGTEDVDDASLNITFDDFLTVNETGLPISNQTGNSFSFNIGLLDAGECGSFPIYVSVDCNVDIGLTHCVEAHIFPDFFCLPPSSEWDESNVAVSVNCDSDLITFSILNTGLGNMEESLQYTIFRNDSIFIQDEFQLDAGISIDLDIQIDGGTYRIEAEQSSHNPSFCNPSIAIEGCGEEATIGFITQFPESDCDPFISVDCRPNTSSFDPNDKQGFPVGFGEEYFVLPNTEIEYLIRFQNTGTDTAFRVVVQDALSTNLDLTSLRLGASSHPYSFELSDNRVLNFIFDDIMLPDSNANEAASHGFLKFKISQMPSLNDGTRIENEAAIFFDFNAAIITNTTTHTIGSYFGNIVNGTTFSLDKQIEVIAYPNPFSELIYFDIKGIDFQGGVFRLYNSIGEEVKEITFAGNQIILHSNGLPSGVYIFVIENRDQQLINSGKIVTPLDILKNC